MNVDFLFRKLRRDGLFSSYASRILGSDFFWRASGAFYGSAIVATTGSYLPRNVYLNEMTERMRRMQNRFLRRPRVLEFGSGLGGNLLAISPIIESGCGVDVNPFYVRIANRLRRNLGVSNVAFETYDGHNLPPVSTFDVVLELGVFERLPKTLVRDYVRQLTSIVKPGGQLLLYFLTEASRSRQFGGILGPDAYVYWSPGELTKLWRDHRLSEVARLDEFPGGGDTFILLRQPSSGSDSPQPDGGLSPDDQSAQTGS